MSHLYGCTREGRSETSKRKDIARAADWNVMGSSGSTV